MPFIAIFISKIPRFYRDKIKDNPSDVDDPVDFIADETAIYSNFSVEKCYLGPRYANSFVFGGGGGPLRMTLSPRYVSWDLSQGKISLPK